MHVTIKKTTSDDPHFIQLASALEQELALRDGDDHAFYAKLNSVHYMQHAVVAYDDKTPVACGAFRPYETNGVEIKRMFVEPACRGRKIATALLAELELWAKALGYTHCLLETGQNQPEANRLYLFNGYKRIANFGKYLNSDNSVCFKKLLV